MLEPLPTLVLLEDDRKGERIPVPLSGTRLGRSSDNDVVINDASVSRHHAVFHRVDGRFFVEDAGSSGGTFVNDKRIPENVMTAVTSGDLVTFGKYRSQMLMLDEYDLENDDDSRTVFMDPGMAKRNPELLAQLAAQAEADQEEPSHETNEDLHQTMAALPPVSSVGADSLPAAAEETEINSPAAAPLPGAEPAPTRRKLDPIQMAILGLLALVALLLVLNLLK